MNEHIEEIINAIPDLVIIFDYTGEILNISQKFLSFFNGSNENDFIGKNVSDIVVPEHQTEFLKNFEDLKTKGYLEKKEYKFLKADGSSFYGEFNAKALKGENGNRDNYLSITRDMTSQKVLLEKLNNSQEMFQLVLDNIPQHIFWKDINSKYLGCNQNFARVAGVGRPENIVDKTDFDLVWRNEEAESFYDIERLVLESGIPEFHVIEPQLQADGKQAWLDVNRIPLHDSNGKIIGLLGTYEDITEKKIAEDKLKESERKYRNIVENSLDGISLTNEQGNIIEWNRGMEDITGLTQDEVLGRPVWDIQFELAPEPYRTREMKNQLKNGLINYLNKENLTSPNQIREQQIQNLDGFIKTLQTSSYLIKTEYGKMIGTIMRDISKQKKAELELKESEEKYRNLFENSPIALMEQDYSKAKSYIDHLKSSGITDFKNYFDANPEEVLKLMTMIKVVDVNRKTLELYKADSKKDFILKVNHLSEIVETNITDEVLSYNKKEFLSFMEGKTIYESEIASKTFTEDIIFLYAKTSVLPGSENNWAKVVVTLIDITENKIAEEKLKESEEKFRNFAELSLLGINIVQDNKIKYINKAFVDIFGYTIDEVKDWGLTEIANTIHPDDREFVLSQIIKKQKGDKDVIVNYQSRGITNSGKIKWLEIYSKTINFEGKPADFITIIDITEKKKAEGKLRELDEIRKELITRVSHELKTPLTSIYGVSQFLLTKQSGSVLYEEIKPYIEMSHRGILRLKELVENLLDASRLDTHRLELKTEITNLSEIISECVKELSFTASSRNLTLNINLPNDIYYDVDKNRFSQVIINLISNAIKNTPTGGEININLVDSNDWIDISFKDTGVGITNKEKEKLFQKFGKIERYGQDLDVDIEGAGLGLYISKEIVELHGGKILVESEGRNKGTTFIIRLLKENK